MGAYLDHNATTPLDTRVLEEMLPFLQRRHGNPSSLHRHGRIARQAVEQAREQVAELVNAHPSEVMFTSGGTEANNLAITGFRVRHPSIPVLCSAIEHASVLEPVSHCQPASGGVLPVDEAGRLLLPALAARLESNRHLVSVMMANNETGVIQDIRTISAVVRDHHSWLHCDAVQAAGKMVVDFHDCGAHLMSISAHKVYGPQGVGALIHDRTVELTPLLEGGDQEAGLRAGTENVAAIVGFGRAAELARQELDLRRQQMAGLRERLEQRLNALSGVRIFAQQAERLANTVCFAVPGFEGESLLMTLDECGFAVSSGSACHSQRHEPSHVLLAMGIDRTLASRAIRVSIGQDTRARDIDDFVDCLRQQLSSPATMLASAWAS